MADEYIFFIAPNAKVYMPAGVEIFEWDGLRVAQDVHVENGQIVTDKVRCVVSGRFNPPLHIEGITAIKVSADRTPKGDGND